MIAVICSGGPKAEICSFKPYVNRQDVVFIGADLGAIYLLENGITPQAIVGDFDSVTATQWERLCDEVQVIEKAPAEKDDTDTDLAVKMAMQYNPTEVIVTGVTGGRLDHYESALRTVYRAQTLYEKTVFKMVNRSNELRFLSPGKYNLEHSETFPYVSFFAHVGDVESVTLRGVKYETTEETIDRATTRFTSNEIISPTAYIEFQTGICLMIRSTD